MAFERIDEIDEKIKDGKEFIRQRITNLRIAADVSEYQMSLDLGQNRGYVQSISSGKAMPSMTGFLNICDYFNITPAEFFDTSNEVSIEVKRINEKLKTMLPEDLELLDAVLDRVLKK